MKLVVNASPLILLGACDHLDLLQELASEVVVPQAVLTELEAGTSKDRAALKIQAAAWVRIAEPVSVPADVAAWDLGAGETAVLSFAAGHDGFTCVLDDRAARMCAKTLNLGFVGTLGVTLAAKQNGLIAAARPLLEQMIAAGYYLGSEIVERSLLNVGE